MKSQDMQKTRYTQIINVGLISRGGNTYQTRDDVSVLRRQEATDRALAFVLPWENEVRIN
jgi:hypothetical protein